MADLHSQYMAIKDEVDKALQEVIDSCAFINGKAVSDFSGALGEYLDVKHVIPCANGTDALQLALMSLELSPGDEVITTPFSFIATVEVVALLRLKPVFVDVDPNTFNLDVSLVEEAITERTKAIIPVHLFGQSMDMAPLMNICKEKGIAIIEDNAQAIGADYTMPDGTVHKTGTMGEFGCISFFPSKNLGAFGDGGALMTNDDTLAAKAAMYANHGSKTRYYHDVIGVNSRLDSMQAAVLNIKLAHLDEYILHRQKAAAYYNEKLGSLNGIQTPVVAKFTSHVYHQYTLMIESGRNELREALLAKDIPCMIYYPVPLHMQPALKNITEHKRQFPVSEMLSKRVLSLPMHTELDNDQLEYITGQLSKHLT